MKSFIHQEDFDKHDENIFIVTQSKIGNYYPTSFEESLILTNAKNTLLRTTLSDVIPQIYKKNKDKLKSKSHFFLIKLGGKKGNFATSLLYRMINAKNEEILKLPEYIQKAIDYIAGQLKEKNNPQNESTAKDTLTTQNETTAKEEIVNE